MWRRLRIGFVEGQVGKGDSQAIIDAVVVIGEVMVEMWRCAMYKRNDDVTHGYTQWLIYLTCVVGIREGRRCFESKTSVLETFGIIQ